MPATIIVRIDDERHATEIRAVGARDLLESFLADAGIKASQVTVNYRTEKDEKKALAGRLDYSESFDQWPKKETL